MFFVCAMVANNPYCSNNLPSELCEDITFFILEWITHCFNKADLDYPVTSRWMTDSAWNHFMKIFIFLIYNVYCPSINCGISIIIERRLPANFSSDEIQSRCLLFCLVLYRQIEMTSQMINWFNLLTLYNFIQIYPWPTVTSWQERQSGALTWHSIVITTCTRNIWNRCLRRTYKWPDEIHEINIVSFSFPSSVFC